MSDTSDIQKQFKRELTERATNTPPYPTLDDCRHASKRFKRCNARRINTRDLPRGQKRQQTAKNQRASSATRSACAYRATVIRCSIREQRVMGANYGECAQIIVFRASVHQCRDAICSRLVPRARSRSKINSVDCGWSALAKDPVK